MTKSNTDQLAALKAKIARSPEEEAVVKALEAAIEAEDVLEDAQEALEDTPSTTV